jgi:hypothetical protein
MFLGHLYIHGTIKTKACRVFCSIPLEQLGHRLNYKKLSRNEHRISFFSQSD